MKQKLAIVLSLLMLCCHAHARKVTGEVLSGETPLAGVIVTDGKSFAQTGRNGKFSFEIAGDAEYVYIVTPSGYMADWASGIPAFYQEAAGKNKFIFDIRRNEDDICWGNPDLFENYKSESHAPGVPFYPVAGKYAFYIGSDVVIMLEDISRSIAWVKGLEALLPDNAQIYVVQSSPLRYAQGGRRVLGTLDIADILHEHKVTYLSGSSPEGAPRGYRVFTTKGGGLEWYYKSLGQPADYQVTVTGLGKNAVRPNSVVADVWDWDPAWKVEWFEDGRAMGGLKPEDGHYFTVTPGQYAENVTIAVENRFGKNWVYNVDMNDYVDVQAHRGGAGLMPENTIEAMKMALDMGVNTLELDLQVSADGQVVVSHDPYFHHRYAIRPDGTYVQENDPKEYLYRMPYSEIAKYDVGSRPSEVWPEKACVRAVKPLAADLISFVENYTKEKGYSPVRYNIEIKSLDAAGEGQNWPTYDAFATICCKFLHSMQLGDRLTVQSFDARALNYIHEKYPEFILSYLIDSDAPEFDKYMGRLIFTPQWLSPHHSITDEELVKKCREKGMRLVPWTVDEPEDIRRMLDLGVEAIISNYPDRVIKMAR